MGVLRASRGSRRRVVLLATVGVLGLLVPPFFVPPVSVLADPPAARLIAVGTNGHIVTSDDDGSTWVERGPGGSQRFNDVSAAGSTVWAVGSSIQYSTDRGTTWVTQYASGGGQSVSAVDTQTAWMAGFTGNPMRTTNGGTTWSPTSFPPGAQFMRGIWALDANRAWIVGNGIWYTADGGATWTTQYGPDPNLVLYHVAAADSTHAYAGGNNLAGPIVLATTNGSTWSSSNIAPASAGQVEGLSIAGPSTVWAAGEGIQPYSPAYETRVLVSSNAGTNWNEPYVSGCSNPVAVTATSAQTAWVVGTGSGCDARTTDGGATWTRMPLPNSSSNYYYQIIRLP